MRLSLGKCRQRICRGVLSYCMGTMPALYRRVELGRVSQLSPSRFKYRLIAPDNRRVWGRQAPFETFLGGELWNE